MDPITLHFNVFQAGADPEGRKSLQVDDPRGTTVGALKRQVFPEAVEARKSVRFITSGRILDDGALLEECKLGHEAVIQVSISDPSSSRVSTPKHSSSSASAKTIPGAKQGCQDGNGDLTTFLYLGTFFFAGGAVVFFAWRKRRHLSLQMSQLFCIFTAIWVYFALCHALPAFCRALARGVRVLGASAATSSDNASDLRGGAGEGRDCGALTTNASASPSPGPRTLPAAAGEAPTGELRSRSVGATTAGVLLE